MGVGAVDCLAVIRTNATDYDAGIQTTRPDVGLCQYVYKTYGVVSLRESCELIKCHFRSSNCKRNNLMLLALCFTVVGVPVCGKAESCQWPSDT
jgi:hypothetical protein